MDINKVIEIIREAKKASKCPPGFKYSKKKKSRQVRPRSIKTKS